MNKLIGELNCDDPDMRTIEGKAIFQLIMETGKCPCCNETVLGHKQPFRHGVEQ